MNSYEDYEVEPKFNLKVESSKTEAILFEIDDIENMDIADYDENMHRIFITINKLDSDGKEIEKAFESELMLFSDVQSKYRLVEAADEIGEQELEYVSMLFRNDKYNRNLIEYGYGDIYSEWGVNIVSGAMHRFYVYPKYRNMGIGRSVIKNLDKILEQTLNLKLRCIVTYPKPDEEQQEGMLKIMIKNIENAGFEKIDDKDNFYIKDYLEDYVE